VDRGVAFGWLALLALAALSIPVSAHPPAEPDHGINNSTFATLWSLDDDAGHSTDEDALVTLGTQTDVPFDSPPEVVETWNDGELSSFPDSGLDRSLVPTNATTSNSGVIRDAHATITAVRPSTRVHAQAGQTPLYVGRRGDIAGFVDYRIALPERDTPTGENLTITRWVSEAAITETRLYVGGERVDTGEGSHTPTLAYSREDVQSLPTVETTIRLESTIEVTWVRERSVCTRYNNTTGCTGWRRSTRTTTDSVDVHDTVAVHLHEIVVSGYVGRYPDGDRAIVAYTSEPWAGFERQNSRGSVNGVWRFYTARDPRFDTLIEHSGSSATRVHSPVHPLTVHAFPMETGPTAGPRQSVSIVEGFGGQRTPPDLPPTVALDAVEEPYTATFGLATRWSADTATTDDQSNTSPESIIARGLVRGVEHRRSLSSFEPIPINESMITLTALNDSGSDTRRVRITLTDATTGRPIETANQSGYVHVAGERVNTSANGTATVTLAQTSGSVSARYYPDDWWGRNPGYIGSQTTLRLENSVLEFLETLFRFAVPVGLFAIGVFLIDRLTGWGVWPPWRLR